MCVTKLCVKDGVTKLCVCDREAAEREEDKEERDTE